MAARRHVFISHRFVDDYSVTGMTNMLNGSGWDIRNSSIRVKEANKTRLESGDIPERTLKRVLRMKISWSQTVVVLIGSSTHESDWVRYEIEEAKRQGKRIVGVYARGQQDAQLPEALEKYANAIVAWNSNSIKSAIDGEENRFESPSGEERPPVNKPSRQNC